MEIIEEPEELRRVINLIMLPKQVKFLNNHQINIKINNVDVCTIWSINGSVKYGKKNLDPIAYRCGSIIELDDTNNGDQDLLFVLTMNNTYQTEPTNFFIFGSNSDQPEKLSRPSMTETYVARFYFKAKYLAKKRGESYAHRFKLEFDDYKPIIKN